MEFNNKIGDRVRKYRTLKGMTQKDLGDKLCVSSKYISRLENNMTETNYHILNDIALSLDVSINDLLGYDELGIKIKRYRHQQKMSQEELAERVGISYDYLKRLEVGNSFVPRVDTLQRIAKVLKVKVDDLINDNTFDQPKIESKKKRKINNYFVLGIICYSILSVDSHFNFLSYIFQDNVLIYIHVLCCILGIFFEIIGFYFNHNDL